MSCNCKKGVLPVENLNENQKITVNGNTILIYTLKIFGFLFLLILLPIINLYIIWLMFSTIVLNKNIDLKPLLLSIGNKFKEKEDDEEEFLGDEFDDLTEDDVVLLDSEEITKEESNK